MSTSTSIVDVTPAEQKLAGRIDAAITNGLAISDQAGGVQFTNAGQVTEFAKMMAVSTIGVRKHLRGNAGACLAIVVQAVEWGISAYAVANKSYLVNDQIAFESQLIQAVILKRAPIKGRIKFEFTGEGPNRVCRAWARLKDDPEEIVEYISPLFKDIQPKNSPLWKNDPDQQQCYYSGRALCRRHFPDVLLGVYAEDELIDAPAIGADRARDVTPAKSLTSKLDALAGGAAARQPAAADAEAFVQDDAGADADAAPPQTIDPARTALLDKLRPKASKGADALRRAMAGLSDDDRALLTDEDHDALGDLAEEADTAAAA